MEYLRNGFLKSFCFERNVKLQVTFQAFDPELDDFVDLEEDAVLQDEVKVVATSRLLDDVSSCSTSVPSTDDEQVSGLEFEVTV